MVEIVGCLNNYYMVILPGDGSRNWLFTYLLYWLLHQGTEEKVSCYKIIKLLYDHFNREWQWKLAVTELSYGHFIREWQWKLAVTELSYGHFTREWQWKLAVYRIIIWSYHQGMTVKISCLQNYHMVISPGHVSENLLFTELSYGHFSRGCQWKLAVTELSYGHFSRGCQWKLAVTELSYGHFTREWQWKL